MVLCFCNKPSAPSAPSEDEQRPVPALPAVPRPAKLAHPTTKHLPADPCTPPRASRPQDASPGRASVHRPIPRIPDFEGLVESETDSDDELLRPSAMRASAAASSPASSTPKGSSSGGNDSLGLSPLSSLINRIGNIGRGSPSQPSRGRAPEPANSADDLTAAAHRAEVRRLTHKMMQEELQNERQPHLSRSYKRSTMSTIKEDPSDAPNVRNSQVRSAVATLDGSGPRDAVEYAVVKRNEDLNLPSALDQKNEGKGTFLLLPRPASTASVPTGSFALQNNNKVALPQGLGIRGRLRGAQARGIKDWVRSSLMADQPARHVPQCEGPSTIHVPSMLAEKRSETDAPGTRENETRLGSLDFKRATSDGQTSKEHQESMTIPHTSAHLREISDSLSSLDEDGSIHEARQAHILVPDRIDPTRRVSRVLHAATIQNAKHIRGSSTISVSSQISSLNLPPPLISNPPEPNREDHALGHVESSHVPESDVNVRPHTLPSRRGFTRLQYLSLGRLLRKSSDTKSSTEKVLGSKASLHGEASTFDNQLLDDKRTVSLDTRHFPESWWIPRDSVGEQDNRPQSTKKESELRSSLENTKDVTSADKNSTLHQIQDVLEDIDSIFGVLIDIDSNRERVASVSDVRRQNKDENSTVLADESIPSTPVAAAYAEVEPYVTSTFPNTQNAESQNHSGAIRPAFEATKHKSVDSFSVMSDSAPTKIKPKAAASPSKFSTWNGPAKARPGLLKSTVQFSAELETIFHSNKENRKPLEDDVLHPVLKYE